MKIEIVLGIILPTVVAYASFSLLYIILKVNLGSYHWLAVIPLTLITIYVIRENKKEWREIKGQG